MNLTALAPYLAMSQDTLAIVIVAAVVVGYFAISSLIGFVGYGFEVGLKKVLDKFLPVKEKQDE